MSQNPTERHDFDGEVAGDSGGGMPWKLVALAIVVGLLVVFFVQNGDKAQVDFLFWGGSWPIWAVIGISVLFGMILDRLGGWVLKRRGDH